MNYVNSIKDIMSINKPIYASQYTMIDFVLQIFIIIGILLLITSVIMFIKSTINKKSNIKIRTNAEGRFELGKFHNRKRVSRKSNADEHNKKRTNYGS